MAPRWKRGGPKGLCGFESRSLRFLARNSNMKFEIRMSGFGLRAITNARTPPGPEGSNGSEVRMCRGSNRSLSHFWGVFRPVSISVARVRMRFPIKPHSDARGSGAWPEGIYSISPLYLAQRALAAALSFLLVESETTRLGLALTEASALEGLPLRRALAAATPGITFASCSRCAVSSLIWLSMLAIAILMCSAGLPLADFLGMCFSPL